MSDTYTASERRPIAARGNRMAKAAASFLARRGVSANAISMAGMFSGILAGVAFACTADYAAYIGSPRLLWILGAIFVQLRLLGNMFDGMVAIERGTASAVGELYNEVPDRISDAAIFVGLGYATLSSSALGYSAACAALFVAYVRAMGKAAGAHQEFCGPFAKPQRMFIVTLLGLWCGLTPASWQSIHVLEIREGAPALVLAVITIGTLFTALRRIRRISAALKRSA